MQAWPAWDESKCLHYSITLFQENQLKKLTGLNLTAVPDDATRSMATKQVARLMYLIMVPAAQPHSQALMHLPPQKFHRGEGRA